MVKLQEGMTFQQKCGNWVVFKGQLPAQAHPRDMGCPENTSGLEGCKYCAFAGLEINIFSKAPIGD